MRNSKVDSVYGEEFFTPGVKPIFVVSYNNYHFEGWNPTEVKLSYTPGDDCSGVQSLGNQKI